MKKIKLLFTFSLCILLSGCISMEPEKEEDIDLEKKRNNKKRININ